ncbi:MAG TPA: flagellar basal body rod protein FlgC [Pyrinomonadaceae bacterium]|jgi:flagellar basal-body rod protein FlgC|nr:flagellar basal body rod protein FlgC [Pyrinomonadaceae bacterium]
MSLFSIFKISSQGMTAQRERLEAASANLANANTTRTAEGGPYRRRDIVFTTQQIGDKWSQNAMQSGLFGGESSPSQGVASEVVVSGQDQFQMQYQPGHPDADANGYVQMPDVDPLEETVNMISAARSFEANATVFNTAKDLAKISLNLGDA